MDHLTRARILLLLVSIATSSIFVIHSARAITLVKHNPIEIIGNAGFTFVNGVRSGSGTTSDPYIIADLDILPVPNSSYGIYVSDTSDAFIIRNVHVEGKFTDGIVLSSVSNGTVESSTLSNALGFGVFISGSTNVALLNNTIAENSQGGLGFRDDQNITIRQNSFVDDGVIAYGSATTRQQWDSYTISADNLVN